MNYGMASVNRLRLTTAVASFVHMSPPGGLGNFHRALPGYVKALSAHNNKTSPTEASIGSMASFTLGSMEITPNKHGRRLLSTKVKRAAVAKKPAAAGVGAILGK